MHKKTCGNVLSWVDISIYRPTRSLHNVKIWVLQNSLSLFIQALPANGLYATISFTIALAYDLLDTIVAYLFMEVARVIPTTLDQIVNCKFERGKPQADRCRPHFITENSYISAPPTYKVQEATKHLISQLLSVYTTKCFMM